MRTKKVALGLALLAFLIQSACAASQEKSLTVPVAASASPGKSLYSAKCTACHEMIPPEKFSYAVWQEKVKEFGPLAELTAKEEAAILAFLKSPN